MFPYNSRQLFNFPTIWFFSSTIKQESFYDKKTGDLHSIEDVLKQFLPKKIYSNVRNILYGNEAPSIEFNKEIHNYSKKHNFEILGQKFSANIEQQLSPRIVRVGAIQNKLILPTTAPIIEQQESIRNRIKTIIHAAHLARVNVLSMNEAWTVPFFMCTGYKYPWLEFAESATNGESTKMICELAAKYQMAIVHPMLERCDLRSTIHNSAVIINKNGKVIGKYHKNHIPRVEDCNESAQFLEGSTGHPVFDVDYAKIAVSICYDRHHPLNFLGFALNGAEIVFIPAATGGEDYQPLWPIEIRNAAIANHYFTVGVNRLGTEQFMREDSMGNQIIKDFGPCNGGSYVTAPDGSRTPGLSRTKDGLLVVEMDLNLCRQMKDKWGFAMTARYDIYAKLLNNYIQSNFKPQLQA